MTPDEILAKVREARAVCDAATPGPWYAGENERCWQLFAEQRLDGDLVHPWQLVQAAKQHGYWPEPKDSRVITSARTGWPEALDIIEQLVARVQELERSALPPEPPPGKMRVTASVPVTYDVTPGQIAAYLRKKGWERIKDATAYHCWKNDAKGHALPFDDGESSRAARKHFQDYGMRFLAQAEGRSTGEVLRDIAGMDET